MLSVIILTKNEERNIAEAINSVKTIADEVLVLDSGSSDKTVEIAENHGARVIKIVWDGWVKARNQGQEKSKHSYVLFLDADERVSERLAQFILREKEQGFGSKVYKTKRINFIGETPIKHGAWGRDFKIRFFDKRFAKWTGGNVHEKVDYGLETLAETKGELLHFAYNKIADIRPKSIRYAKLAAEEIYTKPLVFKLVKMLFSPSVKFVKNYFLQLGFLDGFFGFRIAIESATETALKYYYSLRGKENKRA